MEGRWYRQEPAFGGEGVPPKVRIVLMDGNKELREAAVIDGEPDESIGNLMARANVWCEDNKDGLTFDQPKKPDGKAK